MTLPPDSPEKADPASPTVAGGATAPETSGGGQVSAADERPAERDAGWLERALRLLAPVEGGEAGTALLLTLNVFLLLASYYLLKVAREPLVLAEGGAEVKAYAAAGQAALLVGVVRGFDLLSRRFGRLPLITATTLFFASNLVLFWALGAASVPIGIPFYLWVGVFNVTIIAQFWGFAADVYTEEQGKRLFAIVGVGSSVGALFGSRVAKDLLTAFGPYSLLLVTAAVIVACLGLTTAIHRRENARAPLERRRATEAPIGGPGGLTLVAKDRYLGLLAVLALILNAVNTTGEYLLDRTLLDSLAGMDATAMKQAIGRFKADYFFWVNGVSLALQLFVVSRILRYLGIRVALFVLPVVALVGYASLATAPALAWFARVKIAENSIDYSLQNTTRQALFLPVGKSAKYKAKAVIDGFVVRFGDVISAGVVGLGATIGLSTRGFALFNVGMTVVWLVVVVALSRAHARLTIEGGAGRTRT